jgi:hypothetical protein
MGVDEEYELIIQDEGGIDEVEAGGESTVTIDVFCADEELRMSMEAVSRYGQFNVGAGLSPDDARDIANELLARADELEEDDEESNE